MTVSGKGTVTYYYDAAGNKLKKVTVDNTVTPARTTTTLYLNSSVYQNDSLQFFGTSEGRARADGNTWVYDYFLKDHLGNTRMVITDDYNVASPILEATSYYPFGLQQKGIGLEQTGSLHNRYTFNGKEEQSNEFADGSGMEAYDFGKRMQDPQLGVWHNIDPLADSMRRYSPYAYAFDNPIKFIDDDGFFPFPVTVRAFAPPGAFSGIAGLGFSNDNRGFSASNNVTSRISQTTVIDPTTGRITGGTPVSSTTHWLGIPAGNATGFTDKGGVDRITTSSNDGVGEVSLDEHFAGSNPTFLGGAPDIDVKSAITLTENDKEGYVNASIDLSSKQFPATEAIIGDAKGQSVFLTGGAAYGTPMDLKNGNMSKVSSIDVRINIDAKGNFTGVMFGGKTYSISDWNKMQTAQPAGPFDRDKM